MIFDLELVDWKSIANGEETTNDNQSKKRKKKKRKNGSKENGSNDGSEIGSNGTNENGIETGPEPMEIDGEIKTKKSRSQRRSEQKKKLEEKKIKDQVCSTRIFPRYMGGEIVRNIQADFDLLTPNEPRSHTFLAIELKILSSKFKPFTGNGFILS